MTYSLEQRQEYLAPVVWLANERDMDYVFSHIPDPSSDLDNETFQEYFDVIQTFYLLQSEHADMDEEELEEIADYVKEGFDRFGLSTKALWSFFPQ